VRRLAGFLSCACLTVALGCTLARPVVDFSETSKSLRSEDYPTTFESWTRHAKLIQDIGTVMEIWGTFKSWEFRQAYVAKFAKVYSLADSEREQVAKAQKEAARAVYEIHLVAQSTSDRWNDLERRTSPWRMTLIDGTGAELAPSSIKVERLPEIYENEFFPTRTPFSRTYTVRFVPPESGSESFIGPPSGRMILRLASPMGKVEILWESRTAS
jgi:hypothetical protein